MVYTAILYFNNLKTKVDKMEFYKDQAIECSDGHIVNVLENSLYTKTDPYIKCMNEYGQIVKINPYSKTSKHTDNSIQQELP